MATLFRLSALAYLSPPSAAATGIRTQPVSAVARWDPSADADASAARQLEIEPLDASNARLLDAVHPRRWTDPSPPEVYDLVVIGAGAGGLVSAKQAARRGARSCLISEALAGGDCLNALLRSARAVREVRRAEEFGVRLSAPPAVDFAAFESWQKHVPAVMQRLRAKRAQIAPADSHEGTNAAGADVYQGRGRFTGRNTVEVNGKVLRFRKAVIATGGRAALPPIPGLETAPFLTNANLFNLDSLPPRLAVLGAGAVALEIAHAFSAFGSAVTVLARS
ncbi:hypothetical protein EMIHUDRAFT_460130, partial [Emiliania huxleyi CCMP1516]|uniref:FAD/NAD(P)-binding domain-containing protein n=2 Tax=Emiliania huxleyi TaxID=2903 RepID=A0A0D3I4U1_EMIH1